MISNELYVTGTKLSSYLRLTQINSRTKILNSNFDTSKRKFRLLKSPIRRLIPGDGLTIFEGCYRGDLQLVLFFQRPKIYLARLQSSYLITLGSRTRTMQKCFGATCQIDQGCFGSVWIRYAGSLGACGPSIWILLRKNCLKKSPHQECVSPEIGVPVKGSNGRYLMGGLLKLLIM